MAVANPSWLRDALLLLACCTALPCATEALAQQPGEVDTELKLSATSGVFVGPLDPNDLFGGAVAIVGDLGGDGRTALLVGAPGDDDGVRNAGALWVLSVDVNGAAQITAKISATQGGLDAPLFRDDHFGSSVAALGDVDGDGVPDVAVGLPGSDVGAPQAGLVRILFLRHDGSVKSTRGIGSGVGGFPGTLGADDAFGVAVAGLGDLDGDGIPDLAVGAHGDDGGQLDAGAAWVLFLTPEGRVREGVKLGAGLGGFSGELHAHDFFGAALARVGDVHADGLLELAVGAPGSRGDDASGETDDAEGAVWILHLRPDGTTQGQLRITSSTGGLPTPLSGGDHFGFSLAGTGDVDGDGREDLAVGVPGADVGGPNRGAVRLLLLAPDSSVSSERVIGASQGGFQGPLADDDRFGDAVAALPIDPATGHARLVVGAPHDDDGAENAGAAWWLALQGGSTAQPFEAIPQALAGRAGQPALLLPNASVGDDFIGEPVVVVPSSGHKAVLKNIVSLQEDELGFAQFAEYDTGLNPFAAVTYDFTSDGQPDILTANAGSHSLSLLVQLSVLTAAGDSFAPSIDTPLPFDGTPVALRAGDLDGDGDADVVVAGDAGLTTFLGDGQGVLAAVSFAPVAFLTDLQLGDLDGDGDLDVLATSGASATGPGAETGFATSLFNDGLGNLTQVFTFASGKAVASVLLADFDANGSRDALLAIHELDAGPGGLPQGRIELWLGDGSGVFLPSPVFAGLSLPNADGIHPRWGTLGDVNADGRPDALYTSSDSIALLAADLAQEQPPVVLTLLLGTPAGDLVTSTIPTAYAGKGVAPILADIAPTSGDGKPDCILVWTQDTLAGEVEVPAGASDPVTYLAAFVGDGLGGFVDASPNQFLGAEEPGDAALADVGSAPADGEGGPDVLIPDLAARSLNVWLGDGAGGVGDLVVVPDVDPVDVDALPAGGIWQGGPQTVAVLDLDGDPHPDVAIYSRWDDLAGLFASQSGFVTRHGDGTGHFSGGQDVRLPRAGELAGGDIDGDGLADVVATLRTGGDADVMAVFGVGTDGQLGSPPQQVPAPPGYELTGGLELSDVDGLPGDEILTTARSIDGSGALVVASRAGGALVARAYPLGATWDDVRSLGVGRIDADLLADVAIGLADGRLVLARRTGAGSFEALATNATAAALGGGALRVTEINGDGRADIVSSSASVNGTLDQAFVRELFGMGDGSFKLVTLPSLSSLGANGALRPAVADLDDNLATDLVLTHGGSGNVSLLLNKLSTFSFFGAGKPGSGGLVPKLRGKGYTTLGGTVTIEAESALGGAQALLWIGGGPLPDHPYLAMETVATSVLVSLSGTPGSAGAGSLSLLTHLPNVSRFAGVEFVLQLLVADPGATGPGPSKVAFSNGVAFTVLP